MAKFKVGDRVKILLDGTYGTIDVILDGYSCGVIKGGEKIGRYYPFCYLELVEPKKEGFYHPSYEHEYWYNINGDFSYLGYLQQYEYDPIDGVYKMSFRDIKRPDCENVSTANIKKQYYKKYLFTTEEKVAYENSKKKEQDKSFDLDPHEFERKDFMKRLRDIKPPKFMTITSNPSEPNPFKYFHLSLDDIGTSKKRIPDNVFFNDKKKATTLMFGKDATVVKCGKDDEYSRRIGFLEAYFQATCGLSKTKAKKYLENIVKDKEEKK